MDAYPRKQSNRPVLLAVLATSLAFLFLWTVLTPTQAPTVTKAVAILKGDSAVTGTVTFEQTSKGGPVKVTGELHNLDPLTKRGFHIHQYGDATDGCASSGSHFNPYSKNHGAPTDKDRHVGDLGNIETDEFGVASINIEDSKISLNGETSIIGRSVVVHSGVDDLGRGDNEESLKTGNAGGRAACGVIGLA